MPFVLRLAVVLVFNTIIGVFLTAIGFGGQLAGNVTSSQFIGLSIFLAMSLAGRYRTEGKPWRVPVGVAAGAIVGTLLAVWFTGHTPVGSASWSVDTFLQAVLIGLLFGTIATYFFRQREQLADVHKMLQETRIQQLLGDRERITMQLRLLQAQIEPHFLFNTLANLDSLLDTDVARGRYMLRRLTDYLRTSLSHSRREAGTLDDEMEVIRAYLDIMAIRMEDRLQWHESLEPGTGSVPLAPMLLQPLVENAVRHGIEPAMAGGRLDISAHRKDDLLVVTVSDNGAGLKPHAGSGSGVGLSNIRDRLSVLYGGEAGLNIEENPAGGVRAILWVPAVMPAAAVAEESRG